MSEIAVPPIDPALLETVMGGEGIVAPPVTSIVPMYGDMYGRAAPGISQPSAPMPQQLTPEQAAMVAQYAQRGTRGPMMPPGRRMSQIAR